MSICASRCRNICRRSSPVIAGPGAPGAVETTTRTVNAYGSVFGRPLAVCLLEPPPFSLPVNPSGSPLGNIASSAGTLTDASRPLNDEPRTVLPSQNEELTGANLRHVDDLVRVWWAFRRRQIARQQGEEPA